MATTTPPAAASASSTLAAAPSTGPVIDTTTVLSLLSVLAILTTAYAASIKLLPRGTALKVRLFFVWHAFDALVHTCLEGTFLLNCFFTYYELPKTASPSSGKGFFGFGGGSKSSTKTLASLATAAKDALKPTPTFANPLILTPPGVHFLGQEGRVYGSAYGTNPFALLWQEYAKADRRWGGADLTVISLELLTVFIGAPLAAYICYLLASGSKKTQKSAFFWMTLLATGELYGGFMTFAPEWLSGNVNLDGGNWMYMWVYLVFFNMLWVIIPFWILYESYQYFNGLFTNEEMVDLMNYLPKKDN